MSKSDFLHNLKTARNLFFHRVQTDHPRLDPREVEEQLARAAIWLTPSSVKDFQEKDFAELPEQARKKLAENVRWFRAIAEQVPASGPATHEQTKEAMRSFIAILEILEPYFPSGNEQDRLRNALESVTFPDAVLTWDFQLGTDSTGDPAVWVWVFVASETADRDDVADLTADIRRRVREALSAAGITRWPYIRFRTASEQRALLN